MVKIIIRMKNEIILEKSLTVAFFCLSAECKVNTVVSLQQQKSKQLILYTNMLSKSAYYQQEVLVAVL